MIEKHWQLLANLKHGLQVNTKTRDSRFKPDISAVTMVSHHTNPTIDDTSVCASVTGVLDCFPTPHKTVPTSIVGAYGQTRTSVDNNGEIIGIVKSPYYLKSKAELFN